MALMTVTEPGHVPREAEGAPEERESSGEGAPRREVHVPLHPRRRRIVECRDQFGDHSRRGPAPYDRRVARRRVGIDDDDAVLRAEGGDQRHGEYQEEESHAAPAD